MYEHEFEFQYCCRSFAHSVTQSSFGAPCTYLAASGGPGGFDSGLTQGTQFTITITNDTERTSIFSVNYFEICSPATAVNSDLVLLQANYSLWVGYGWVREPHGSKATQSFDDLVADLLMLLRLEIPTMPSKRRPWQSVAQKLLLVISRRISQ